MSDEEPPPLKKYTEFDNIEDLRQSISEDIEYYYSTVPKGRYNFENGGHLAHQMYLNIHFLENYLKKKFDL